MITLTDGAVMGKWEQSHGEKILAKLGEFGDRFSEPSLLLDVDAETQEHVAKGSGVVPGHGRQEFELRIGHGVIEGDDRTLDSMAPQMLYRVIDRDLRWLESGRCLDWPSTKQLREAREFLSDHLGEVENQWRVQAGEDGVAEATPVPLHVHLWNVVQALTPKDVTDAHLFRAKEVREEMLADSPVGPGEEYPEDYVLRKMAQAIADAEGRGNQGRRELLQARGVSETVKALAAMTDVRDPIDHLTVALEDNRVGDTVVVNAQLLAKLLVGHRNRLEMLEFAWTIIANASGGNWGNASAEWRAAAARFRDEYHEELRS